MAREGEHSRRFRSSVDVGELQEAMKRLKAGLGRDFSLGLGVL